MGRRDGGRREGFPSPAGSVLGELMFLNGQDVLQRRRKHRVPLEQPGPVPLAMVHVKRVFRTAPSSWFDNPACE